MVIHAIKAELWFAVYRVLDKLVPQGDANKIQGTIAHIAWNALQNYGNHWVATQVEQTRTYDPNKGLRDK